MQSLEIVLEDLIRFFEAVGLSLKNQGLLVVFYLLLNQRESVDFHTFIA